MSRREPMPASASTLCSFSDCALSACFAARRPRSSNSRGSAASAIAAGLISSPSPANGCCGAAGGNSPLTGTGARARRRWTLSFAVATTAAPTSTAPTRTALARCFVARFTLRAILRRQDVAVHVARHRVFAVVVMVAGAVCTAAGLGLGGPANRGGSGRRQDSVSSSSAWRLGGSRRRVGEGRCGIGGVLGVRCRRCSCRYRRLLASLQGSFVHRDVGLAARQFGELKFEFRRDGRSVFERRQFFERAQPEVIEECLRGRKERRTARGLRGDRSLRPSRAPRAS